MKKRITISVLAVGMLAVAASGAQQQALTVQTLRGYLDKMGLRYVPHPKNPDAVVVPRSENKRAERLDLYVEVRKDQSVVLSVYPRLRGRYFTLERAVDREKLLQRLLEANHRSFAAFFVDTQGRHRCALYLHDRGRGQLRLFPRSSDRTAANRGRVHADTR